MPSGISRADVEHLAGLARIELSTAEIDRLAADLPAILEHVATVQECVNEQAGDLSATSHPLPVDNVFRPDVVRPSLTSDEALAGAPESDQQRFLVPKILGED